MYGMLLESIQHFIKEIYGESEWRQVLEHAGLRNMIFSTHKVYQDSIMNDIADSCAHVLKTGTAEYFMFFFGKCFVNFFSHYGYDNILRVSGRHYRDFLNGIDNLHETMRFSYPRLQSPSFYVEKEDRNGCILNYRTRRLGFTQYVVGQLKQCATKFYNVDVDVIVLEERIVSNGCHVIFRLNFDNQGFKPPQVKPPTSGNLNTSLMPGKIFFKVFPFCVVFDSDMIIQNTGPNLKRLFGDQLIHTDIRKTFQLRRPIMAFTWQNVLCLQKVVFELETRTVLSFCLLSDQFTCDCVDREINHKPLSRTVILRGQMKLIQDWNSVAFLCTPLLGNLEDMEALSMYINDLSLHDNSRDMVLAGFQHASQLEHLIDQQMEKSKLIGDNLHKLDIWRQKSDSLLYSMIPQTIAVRLKNGVDPVDTCETFDQVTILFSYIIGFMDICVNVSALKVVECINKVFTLFDLIVDKYNVFKVETLGDAVYMVAGGVPDRTPGHAVNVAGLALELLQQATQLTNPATRQKLKIRIGMHTGGVVAGVVGKRMPQYCLFGDAVNTAARMQTNSESGRVHISEPCHRCLKGSEFVTVFRGHLNIKGKGEMKTYWLAGKRGDPQLGQTCAVLKAERCQKYIKQQKQLSAETYDLHGIQASRSCANLRGLNTENKESFDNVHPTDGGDEDEELISTTPGTGNSSGNVTPHLPFRFTLDSETPSGPGTPSLISPQHRMGEITPEAIQMAISTSARSMAPGFLVSPPSPLSEEGNLPSSNTVSCIGYSSHPIQRSSRLCGTSEDLESEHILPYNGGTVGDFSRTSWLDGIGEDQDQIKSWVQGEFVSRSGYTRSVMMPGDTDRHLWSNGNSTLHKSKLNSTLYLPQLSYVKDTLLKSDVKDTLVESDVEDTRQKSDVEDTSLRSDVKDTPLKSDAKDTLLKLDVKDTLLKSDVKDTLRKSDVKNTLQKSDVEDTLLKSDVKDALLKSDVEDTLLKSDVRDTRLKSDANDTLLRSDGKETLLKSDVKDTLLKSDVKDTLLKSDVEDTLLKSDVRDTRLKSDANDTLLRSDVKDTLLKSDVKDTLLRSDVKDTLLKLDVKDTLLKSDVEDALLKSDANDTLLRSDGKGTLLKSDFHSALLKPACIGTLLKSDNNETLLMSDDDTLWNSDGNDSPLKSDGLSTLINSDSKSTHLKSDDYSTLMKANDALTLLKSDNSDSFCVLNKSVLPEKPLMNNINSYKFSSSETGTSRVEPNLNSFCPMLKSQLPEVNKNAQLQSFTENQKETTEFDKAIAWDSQTELLPSPGHFHTPVKSMKETKMSKITQLCRIFEKGKEGIDSCRSTCTKVVKLGTGETCRAESGIKIHGRNETTPQPIIWKTTQSKTSHSVDASRTNSKILSTGTCFGQLKPKPFTGTSTTGHKLEKFDMVSNDSTAPLELKNPQKKHIESQMSNRSNFFSEQMLKKYSRLDSHQDFKSSSDPQVKRESANENKLFRKSYTSSPQTPNHSKLIGTIHKNSKKEIYPLGVSKESTKSKENKLLGRTQICLEYQKISEMDTFGKPHPFTQTMLEKGIQTLDSCTGFSKESDSSQITDTLEKGLEQKDMGKVGASFTSCLFKKSSQKADVSGLDGSVLNSIYTQKCESPSKISNLNGSVTQKSPPDIKSELFIPPSQRTLPHHSTLGGQRVKSMFLRNRGDNNDSKNENVNGEILAPDKSKENVAESRQEDEILKS